MPMIAKRARIGAQYFAVAMGVVDHGLGAALVIAILAAALAPGREKESIIFIFLRQWRVHIIYSNRRIKSALLESGHSYMTRPVPRFLGTSILSCNLNIQMYSFE